MMGPNDDPTKLDVVVREILQELQDQYQQEADEDYETLHQVLQESEQGDGDGS